MSIACIICGEDDPRVVKERHHVFGRNNSQETVLLCHNCHDKITATQNKFPPSARKKTASASLKRAYAMRSSGEMLKVIGEHLIRFSDKILEEEDDKNSN